MDKQKINKTAQAMMEMAQNMGNMKEDIIGVADSSQQVLSDMITPEIEESLSERGKTLLNATRESLDFSKGNPLDRLNNLTKHMRHADFSK